MRKRRNHLAALVLALPLAFAVSNALAQKNDAVSAAASQQRSALLDTLKELVSIESGSSDIEGLDKIRAVIAARLVALGAKVEIVEPDSASVKYVGVPERIGKIVRATFTGTGTAKILLLAHMDTVYPRSMLAQQPFRIDGDRAWGLGIADDKLGIALILHSIAILKAMTFAEYGVLTVLINADEEIGSPGSANLITKLGGEHDAVLSFESGGFPTEQVDRAAALSCHAYDHGPRAAPA